MHFVGLALFFPETSRKIVQNGSLEARGIHRTLFSLLTKRQLQSSEESKQEHSTRIRIPNPLACIQMLFHKGSFSVIFVGSIYYTVSRTLGASLSAQCIDVYRLNYLEAGLIYLPSGIAGMISSYSTGKNSQISNIPVEPNHSISRKAT